jgi:antitoxin MazE
MKLRVQKWGNSLALRIPKALAIEANVTSGSTVEMSLSNGELKIKPIEDTEYTLEELLSGITAENIHDEVTTGIPQGKETW